MASSAQVRRFSTRSRGRFVTGAAIEWLEDMTLIDDPAETASLARSVDTTDGVYVVPAFTGLGAPHWDQRARGTIVGMTRGTRKEHVVRARPRVDRLPDARCRGGDGGRLGYRDALAEGRRRRGQEQLPLSAPVGHHRLEIVRPVVDETTALGSAYAAGLAVGYWSDPDELRSNWQVDAEFEPEMDRDDADRRYDRWSDAVDRSRDWAQDAEE